VGWPAEPSARPDSRLVAAHDHRVPAGTQQAVFELSWLQNWARYPTNDLDLVLVSPAGTVIQSTFRAEADGTRLSEVE
jgi:hypothetical protein